MSFNKMKKQRTNIEDLAKQLESQGKKTYEKDERYWYPKRDEKGNGYAVIRFLPPMGEEATSFVRTYRHGFQAKNGWYIEECPTTIGKDCPVCKANGELYDTLGKEAASRIVSGSNGRKRQMQYVSNIYVISDPETPENEGKNFLYKYGAKIFDKIKLATKPEFPDEVPFDPFDMWKGADFTLKIRRVEGQVNYDSSSFSGIKGMTLAGEELDDKALEVIYNAEYSLDEIIAEDKFKDYKDLESRFNRVTGATTSAPSEDEDFTGKAHDPEPAKEQVEDDNPLPDELLDEEDAESIDFFKDIAKKS